MCFYTDENNICINCGCMEDCRKCTGMFSYNCFNYESKNTRRSELDKLYKDIMEEG